MVASKTIVYAGTENNGKHYQIIFNITNAPTITDNRSALSSFIRNLKLESVQTLKLYQ